MPGETDDDQRPPLSVEKMLNALDELREAMDRLATERRAAAGEPPTTARTDEPLAREHSIPRP